MEMLHINSQSISPQIIKINTNIQRSSNKHIKPLLYIQFISDYLSISKHKYPITDYDGVFSQINKHNFIFIILHFSKHLMMKD